MRVNRGLRGFSRIRGCHCEPRNGEAIQTEKALTLDCFAQQCAARSQ
ncbi:MAG: hypothetical protein LBT00_08030 [Spirochaetaceae bacterium]|nr:hypothetical protein [Spirochaetaceae bacterium]